MNPVLSCELSTSGRFTTKSQVPPPSAQTTVLEESSTTCPMTEAPELSSRRSSTPKAPRVLFNAQSDTTSTLNARLDNLEQQLSSLVKRLPNAAANPSQPNPGERKNLPKRTPRIKENAPTTGASRNAQTPVPLRRQEHLTIIYTNVPESTDPLLRNRSAHDSAEWVKLCSLMEVSVSSPLHLTRLTRHPSSPHHGKPRLLRVELSTAHDVETVILSSHTLRSHPECLTRVFPDPP